MAEGEIEGYSHIISTFKERFTWIALLNVDEFLVIHQNATQTRCFSDYLTNFLDFGGVVVPWAFFANDHIIDRNISALVTESFQRRWRFNNHIKSIVNPQRVVTMEHAHYPVYREPFYAVDADKRKYPSSAYLLETDQPYAKIQLNHYWTKSYKEWLAKMMRGYGMYHHQRSVWEFEAHAAVEDLVLDRTMHIDFVPTIRNLLD